MPRQDKTKDRAVDTVTTADVAATADAGDPLASASRLGEVIAPPTVDASTVDPGAVEPGKVDAGAPGTHEPQLVDPVLVDPVLVDPGGVVVTCPSGPRRRAGFQFGPGETHITFDDLDDDTVAAIAADPFLVVRPYRHERPPIEGN